MTIEQQLNTLIDLATEAVQLLRGRLHGDPIDTAIAMIAAAAMRGRQPNVTEIAAQVHMTPQGLRRNKAFRSHLDNIRKAMGCDTRRGHIVKDGASQSRSVEAVDEVNWDDVDSHIDRG